jgi:flavin reductase (DIM6/NTAB) family NADH-FMN oxidoreductase RutF
MTNYSPEVDPTEALRAAFRRHASGVSVITLTGAEGQPVGFTATSMTSLGANPPLASFNVASGSSTWPSLCQATHVAIHTLGQRNLALAQRMAADHTQRFTPNDWSFGAHGLPILNDATAVMICSIREIHNVDSNAVVIVNILEGLSGEEDEALLYYNRRYMSPGRALN